MSESSDSNDLPESEVPADPETDWESEDTSVPTVIPEENIIPDDSDTPEETPMPEPEDDPEIPFEPEITSIPEISQVPEEPEDTPVPEASPVPDISQTPEGTPVPEISPVPDVVSPTPEGTPMPEISPTPEVSVTPEGTPTPEISPTPSITQIPENLTFTCDLGDVSISALTSPDNNIPSDSVLHGEKLEEGSDRYAQACASLEAYLALGEEDACSFTPFNIYFTAPDSSRIEPESGSVEITMNFTSSPYEVLTAAQEEEVSEDESTDAEEPVPQVTEEEFVVQVLDDGTVIKLNDDSASDGQIAFQVSSFSVVGPVKVVRTTAPEGVSPTPKPSQTPDGLTFSVQSEGATISAKVSPESGIPEDAALHAEKLDENEPEYANAYSTVREHLNLKEDDKLYFLPYDVYFSTTESERLEPEAGTVEITMTFDTDPFGDIPADTPQGDPGISDGPSIEGETPEISPAPVVVEEYFVHILDDGTVEQLTADSSAGGQFVFQVTSFSIMGPVKVVRAAQTGVQETDVAKIVRSDGEVGYETLQEAIDNVEDVETIVLLKNVTEIITSGDEKTYTLDLNGLQVDGNNTGSVFTITAGNVTIQNGTIINGQADNGGGIHAEGKNNTVSLTLNSITISGCKANAGSNPYGAVKGLGGGIYAKNTKITIESGSSITACQAAAGGGIAIDRSVEATINGISISDNICTSSHNAGQYRGGGGIYIGSNNVNTTDIQNVIFTRNSAENGASGAALVIHSKADINNCQITWNTSENTNGSIVDVTEDVSFIKCEFSNNTSYQGTLDTNRGTMTLDGCTISKNTSIGTSNNPAGGIRINGGDVNITNQTIIENNESKSDASDNNDVAGGIVLHGGSLTIDNSIITNNKASGTGNVSGGIRICGSNSNSEFQLNEGAAVYDNDKDKKNNVDIYIAKNSWRNIQICEASSMAAHDKSFEGYKWIDSDGSIVDIKSLDKSKDYFLTAYWVFDSDVAQYKEDRFNTLQGAINKAKEDNPQPSNPPTIMLIYGDDNDDERGKSFPSDPVTIDIPVKIDLRGRSINTRDNNGILFNIQGENASLTLTGSGTVNGIISTDKPNSLIFDLETQHDLNVELKDSSFGQEYNDCPIELTTKFRLDGKLNIKLGDSTHSKLQNTLFQEDTEIKDFIVHLAKLPDDSSGTTDSPKISTDQVQIENEINNAHFKLVLDEEGSYLNAVNQMISDGVFMYSAGDDDNDGTLGSPVRTFSAARELLKDVKSKEKIIYLIDDGAYTIDDEDEKIWNEGDKESAIIIKRYVESGQNASGNPLITVGDGKELTLSGNIIIDGDLNYKNEGSLIKVVGGRLDINDNAILRNNNVESSRQRNYGGAVYCEGGTVNMDGGSIHDCSAKLGGGIFADSGTVNLSDGTIFHNTAVYYNATKEEYGSGGGICVRGEASLNMTGGMILSNEATTGGGISLGNDGLVTDEKQRDYFSLKMDGGSILNNTAHLNGGGIFIQCSHHASISSGYIQYNHCNTGNFGGGGIYVNGKKDHLDGILYLENVLITNNKAKYGAGIAACATSTTKISNDSIIYNNKAGENLDDPFDILISTDTVEPMDPTNSYKEFADHISRFMLDGTPYRWKIYKDGSYASDDYLDSTTRKWLYTEESPKNSNGISTYITNNSASVSGGGIGSNGSIIIGSGNDETVQFKVQKNWNTIDGTRPKYIDQINIWALGIKENSVVHAEYDQLRKVSNGYIYWVDTVEFKDLISGCDYEVLEEVIYIDGRHVWSANGKDYAKAVEDIMDQMYGNHEFIWSDDPKSPYHSTLEYKASADLNSGTETTDQLYIFTNTERGSLAVSKAVIPSGSYPNTKWHFQIHVDGAKENYPIVISPEGKNKNDNDEDYITFDENGDVDWWLEGGQTLTIYGLPVEAKYEVTELIEPNPEQNCITSSTDASGIVSAVPTANASFTNMFEEHTGSLMVTKTVMGNAGDKDAVWYFTVTLDNKNVNGKYGDLTFQDGFASFALKHGQTMTADGLPAGTQCTVVELSANTLGYTTTISPKNPVDPETPNVVEIPAEGSAGVEFINTKNTGSLAVSKVVSGSGDKEKEWKFDITVIGADGEYPAERSYHNYSAPPETVTFVDQSTEVTIKHGETLRIDGLPVDAPYIVAEQQAEGYNATTEGKVGIIPKGSTAVVKYTNDRPGGNLKVSKTVTGPGDESKDWHFTVTLSDTSISGTYGDMTFEKGIATFTLKHGESKNAYNLPAGITYTVDEAEAADTDNGYSTFSTNGSGIIPSDDTAKADFYNNRGTGDLKVTKTVLGNAGDKTKDWHFTVELSDTTISGTYGDMMFTDGVANFTLKHDETKTATDLPAGITCTVTEVESGTDGYSTDIVPDNPVNPQEPNVVKIPSNGDAGVQFINIKSTGSLAITKTVTGNAGEKDGEWHFEITVNGAKGDYPAAWTYHKAPIENAPENVQFTNGKAEVTLKHGQTVLIEGLPVDAAYSVIEKEADQNGYTTTVEGTTEEGDTGTIPKDTAIVNYTNDRPGGSLEVSKTVTGPGEKSRDWHFTITLSDSSISGTYGDMTFSNGIAEFTLKHGETKKAVNLPAGITYTVVENDVKADEYSPLSPNCNGTIPSNGSASAAFVNNRLTGSLSVSKIVTGNAGDTDKDWHFTVTLSDTSISGTYGDMEFSNGVAEFTLKHEETKTARNLPAGITYTVTETEANQGGYGTTPFGASGTIQESGNAATFINSKSDSPSGPTPENPGGNETPGNPGNPGGNETPGNPGTPSSGNYKTEIEPGSGEPVEVGQTVKYEIHWKNNTGESAQISIRDPLDSDVDFVYASQNGIYNAATHTVTWDLGVQPAGASGFVTLEVTVVSSEGGTVDNQAHIKVGNKAEIDTDVLKNPEPYTSPAPSTTPETSGTPTPTVTPEISGTPAPTVTPEISVTPSVSVTPEPSVTPELSLTPEPTVTPEATVTPTAEATPAFTPTPGVSSPPSGQSTPNNSDDSSYSYGPSDYSEVPKTGDESRPGVWLALTALSLLGMIGILAGIRYRKKDK